ncbi:MAG: biopolymer transporter ExbD [Gammaproteobacteria bacterium]|nr:biopolymer transporter ExbD [Gammaproteobacteria bacterium]MDH3415042.1 biopolymer transporter ExbD [Gammaproteobacteria bacterium]
MKKNRGALRAEEEDNEINLTPMLDVVFIMLIFFIVTASFIKEAGIDVTRPDATTADKQEDAAILIAISANDEIWIDRRETDPRALRTAIERLHSENPKGSIVIQADEASTNEMLVIVMEAAKQVGVANVAIATDDI